MVSEDEKRVKKASCAIWRDGREAFVFKPQMDYMF